MKALEKDRTRRYGSPAELSGDVRRHLKHEPVIAGPPSQIYRMRKFIRRHRIGSWGGNRSFGNSYRIRGYDDHPVGSDRS